MTVARKPLLMLLPGPIRHILTAQWFGYLLASVVALAVDLCSFFLLLETGTPAGLCAAIAYTLGIVVHWILLSRSVFQAGTHAAGRARTVQKVVFLVSTWGGLALTTGIVSTADALGADVRLSKGVAVVFSFLLNYFIRKHYVFTAAKRAA
jgi:putative flippase GtrA